MELMKKNKNKIEYTFDMNSSRQPSQQNTNDNKEKNNLLIKDQEETES